MPMTRLLLSHLLHRAWPLIRAAHPRSDATIRSRSRARSALAVTLATGSPPCNAGAASSLMTATACPPPPRKGSHRHIDHRRSDEERQRILLTCNKPEFWALPPRQIVPVLADRGRYIGSERSFYRVLHAHG
jgi:hypothetical protein